MAGSSRDRLVGPVISLPTFTDQDQGLLPDRQRRHIRWLIDRGITEGNGVLLIAGGYGEGYFLEDDEFYALADLLAEEAADAVATMVGIFDLSARAAARKARYAARAGIDFIELGLPHYAAPSEDDVFLHHQYVNDGADIGIMTYNNFWTIPLPGLEISQSLLERFADLENLVGVKWSSASEGHYVAMLQMFGDRLNFIDNRLVNSQGPRLGMKGFVDFYGNVAPRLSLKKWELFRRGRYEELDSLLSATHVDLAGHEAPTFVAVADGPGGKLRWELLGLHSGPLFAAQATPPEPYVQYVRRAIDASSLRHWVDWRQSIVE